MQVRRHPAAGPLDRLVITGPLNISGTRLSGYDLSSRLGAIAAFAGIKPSTDTVIQTLSAGLRVAPEGIKADNLLLDVPSIGTLTGDGIIGSDTSMDFKMLPKLATGPGSLLGSLTGASASGQSRGLPFLVKGTTSNPRFLPAIGNELKTGLKDTLLQGLQGKQGDQSGAQQGQKKQDLRDALGGLFGGKDKKKKP